MNKFEYMFVVGSIRSDSCISISNGVETRIKEPTTVYLNSLGNNGWELVSVDEIVHYLKRVK